MVIGITGANGFIGSCLCKALDKNRHDYQRFDRQRYSLFKLKDLEKFVKDKDSIVHLAGCLKGENIDMVRVNSYGTHCLVEAIKTYNPDCRLVFASTFHVYGYTDKPTAIKEDRPLTPKTIYGISKKLAEDIITFYNKHYGLKAMVLRLTNVYGCGCKPNTSSIVPTIIYNILKNRTIFVNSDGSQVRDFINVSDVADAFVKAITYRRDFDVINICTGRAVTINKVIGMAASKLGSEPRVEYRKDIKPDHLIGDNSRAKKLLNFKPGIRLEDGLEESIKWIRSFA